MKTQKLLMSFGRIFRLQRGILTQAVAAIVSFGILAQVEIASAGTIRSWGGSSPPNLTNVVAVAAASATRLALTSDGSVVSWGSGAGNQVPPGLSNVVAVAATGAGSVQCGLALTAPGRLSAWGSGGATNVPPPLWNVTSLGAGRLDSASAFGVALTADRKLVAWGNPYGTTSIQDVPSDLGDVVAIAVGGAHVLALRADGTVMGWGLNTYGQATGTATFLPTGVSTGLVTIAGVPLSNVTAVAAGYTHSVALRADGTVFGWGKNDFGQALGTPSGINLTNPFTGGPVLVQGQALSSIMAIGCGPDANHNLAITSNGTVVAWGNTNPNDVPLDLPFALSVTTCNGGSFAIVESNALTTPPAILRPPMSQTAPVGSKVWLHVRAAGAGQLHYQWYFGATALPSGTNSILLLQDLQPASCGQYSVAVSNDYGTTVSPGASLSVVPAQNTLTLPALEVADVTNTIQFTGALDGSERWLPLVPAIAPADPRFLLDQSALGHPWRFYRSTAPNLAIHTVPTVSLVGALGATNVYALEYFDKTQRAWSPLATGLTITNQPQYIFDTLHIDQPHPPYRVLQIQ